MSLRYYNICTRHPEFIDEFHRTHMEPEYMDFRMILSKCNDDIINRCEAQYSSKVSYNVAKHIEKNGPLTLSVCVMNFCLKHEHELLHRIVSTNEEYPLIDSYEESDLRKYLNTYPNDKIIINTLEECYSDDMLFYIITNNLCKYVTIRDLFNKKDIENTLTYLIVKGTYNVNDIIECIEYCGYHHLYKILDTSKFNFCTCTCKENVLERGIVSDYDIIKEYFKLKTYNDKYLKAIKNKNMGGLILKLRNKYDMTLLKYAHEFGITGIVMTIHYDDEVVGKGTPCPMHILLNLMEELPSHLFNVSLVRVRYIDNLVRVLDRYNYYKSGNVDFSNVYHDGIMDYYARYPKGVIDYIKSVDQDLVLALNIVNGPKELHHLLSDKYISMLN